MPLQFQIDAPQYVLGTCAVTLVIFGAALHHWLTNRNLQFGKGGGLTAEENPLLFWTTVSVTSGFLLVVALSALLSAARLLLASSA